MFPISGLAQKALDAIQAAIPAGESHFERGRAVLNLLKLAPQGSALARALQADRVWPGSLRDQHIKAWSGLPAYSYLQRVGFGGWAMGILFEHIEAACDADRAAAIEERHIAKALADGGLRDIGIDGAALITEVTRMEAAAGADRVFVLMPFRREFDAVYNTAIRPAVETARLRCERADEIDAPGVVLEQIDERIRRAAVIVADLTGLNPNVMQEVGYARALKRSIVFLMHSDDGRLHLPFDVRAYRVLPYQADAAGLATLRDRLIRTLQEVWKP